MTWIFARQTAPSLAGFYPARLKSSPLISNLARSAVWSLAGALISRALTLVSSILVAHMLGKEGFGELGIIQSTVGMFGVLAGFGLGLTATKNVAECRTKDPARAGRIIVLSTAVTFVLGGLMALTLVALAPWLAERTLAAPHLTGLLQVSSGLIFLGALNGCQSGALAGFEAFKSIARINLLAGLISFPLLVGGVWYGGLVGGVWGLVASLGVNWFFNHLALRAEAAKANVPLSFSDCGREWKVLWNFSLPAMLCSLMIAPVNWVCLAILANQIGGYADMGIFNAANQWRTAILFVPQALTGIVLPTLASLDPKSDRLRYQKVFWGTVAIIGSVALALALGVIAGSDFIIRSYGAGFGEGRGTLILLALAAVNMAVNNVLGADIISQGRMWAGLACNAAWAVTALALACWLVPTHGAFGLATSILASYPIHSVCLLALNLRRRSTGGPVTERHYD